MKNEKMTFDEKILGNFLRNELFKVSQPNQQATKEENFSNVEYISKNPQEIAPQEDSLIMRMNEDQILDFVEMLDVKTLSTLSVKELNRIGEVLGVEPSILLGMEGLE